MLVCFRQGDQCILQVAPTGIGKSLNFMLPAYTRSGRTTIVIVPLLELQNDIMRQCLFSYGTWETWHLFCRSVEISWMQALLVLPYPLSMKNTVPSSWMLEFCSAPHNARWIVLRQVLVLSPWCPVIINYDFGCINDPTFFTRWHDPLSTLFVPQWERCFILALLTLRPMCLNTFW